MKWFAWACLATVCGCGLIAVLWVGVSALDRQLQAAEVKMLDRRATNQDAKSCRARGGFPVWGNGFTVATTDLKDCKLLPVEMR